MVYRERYLKDGEEYIFQLDRREESWNITMGMLGQFAHDPESSFTWYDAAIVSKRLQKQRRTLKGLLTERSAVAFG